jgi:hypothetical protein
MALAFTEKPSYGAAVDLLVEIGKQAGVRTHRPLVLRGCMRALNLCYGPDGLSFGEAAIRMREQNRLIGRPLPRRAVGSTLLLKGLEAEVAVILNPGVMNVRNLYVAMTRGSKALIICSPTSMAGNCTCREKKTECPLCYCWAATSCERLRKLMR